MIQTLLYNNYYLSVVKSTQPIPISKKCRSCGTVKLLNEFEIDEKREDKHENVCKDCVAKEGQKKGGEECNCGNCIEGRIIKTAFYAIELLLSRVENGLKLPDEMMILIQALAHRSGLTSYCEKCNKELDT
jgi:RecJ-like exonuclease